MICLILQGTRFQVQVLKPCKSVQESSSEVLDFKVRQLVSIEISKATEAQCSTASQQISYLSRFMKINFSELISLQSVNTCLGFLFSQP